MAKSKIRNKLVRLVEAPSPRRIKRIQYAVTLLCNSFCKMCDIWRNGKGKNHYPTERELGVADLRKALSGASLLQGLDDVTLTGGEPFLRKDIFDIAQFFLETFPRCELTVNSNFYLQDEILAFAEQIHRAGQGHHVNLCFSLDGLQATHDGIRRVKGGYAIIVDTVEKLRERSEIHLTLSFTVLPENHQELFGVFELSRHLKSGFTFRLAEVSDTYYGNAGMSFAWSPEALAHTDTQIQRIIAHIRRDRPALRRLASWDLDFFSRLVDYRRSPSRLFTCYSGSHSMYMDSFGNLYPCIMLGTKLGNIREQALEDIWLSKSAEAIRQDIAAERCHCWTECEAVPSLQRGLPAALRLGKAH